MALIAEPGVDSHRPVSVLREFNAVDDPGAAVVLRGAARDRGTRGRGGRERECQGLRRERIEIAIPKPNGGGRRPDAAGRDRDIRHALQRMDVNESRTGGYGLVFRMELQMNGGRHGTEKTDHQDGGESERGFRQAIAFEFEHGARGGEPGREVKAVDGRNGDHCRKQAELEEDQPAVGRFDEIAEGADFVPAIDDAGRQQ